MKSALAPLDRQDRARIQQLVETEIATLDALMARRGGEGQMHEELGAFAFAFALRLERAVGVTHDHPARQGGGGTHAQNGAFHRPGQILSPFLRTGTACRIWQQS